MAYLLIVVHLDDIDPIASNLRGIVSVISLGVTFLSRNQFSLLWKKDGPY
jgi:hypothetical protein